MERVSTSLFLSPAEVMVKGSIPISAKLWIPYRIQSFGWLETNYLTGFYLKYNIGLK